MLVALTESSFQITPVGLEVDSIPSFEELEAALRAAWDLGQFSKWAQIDLLILAADVYGEQFTQLIDDYHYSPGTVANLLWVGRNVPLHARVEGVSFAHHQVVAPATFTIEEKVMWLERAREARWSRDQFRLAVAGLLVDGPPPPDPFPTPVNDRSCLYMVLDWIDGKVDYTPLELRDVIMKVLNERKT